MHLEINTTFEAAHKLTEGVPVDSPCRNLHGHSYRVKVVVRGTVPEKGILIDSDEVKELIKMNMDHSYLNDEMSCNPSVENIAWWIRDLIMEGRSDIEVHLISVQEGFDGAKASIGSGST